MSLKSTKTKRKGIPRAMPVEAIVTRNKSAQQKKQVDEKIETVYTPHKNERKKKRVPKPQPNLHNIKKTNDTEFYPEKHKRKPLNKKIVLKPKHFYKVIGNIHDKSTINKRKLCIPQRGNSNHRRSSSPSNDKVETNEQKDLSMFEMIKLIEDNGSLDEEDFLEILTCPSPVWWEDPPDERNYIEEPLNIENSIVSMLSNKIDRTMNNSNKRNNVNGVETITCIKEISTAKFSDHFKHKRRKLEVLLSNIKNKTKSEIDSLSDVEIISNTGSNRGKRNSESTDGDSLGIDDEILRDLENMEIPIENRDTKNSENNTGISNKFIDPKKCKVFENDKDAIKKKKMIPNSTSAVSKCIRKKRKKTTIGKKSKKSKSVKDSDSKLVDPLQIPDEILETDKIQEALKSSDNNEFITLYKIISNEDIVNDDKNRVNSYYKQCKNLRKQKTKDGLDNSEIKDSILISDSSNLKYCMKCSSIFDTGHCKYCVKRKEYSKRVKDIKTEYLNIINNIC